MATKRELRDEIGQLAGKLGETPDLDGLNHDALTKLRDDLAERAAAQSTTDPAPPPSSPPPVNGADDGYAGGPPATAAQVPEPPGGYSVAQGKAITSLRGVLGPGSPVTANDFQDGTSQMGHLLSRGYLVKR